MPRSESPPETKSRVESMKQQNREMESESESDSDTFESQS